MSPPINREASGSLRLRFYSNGGALWRELRDEFNRDPSSRAVFSGPLSLQRGREWILKDRPVLRGRRLVDVSELWRELASALSASPSAPALPRALDGPELLEEISDLITHTERLSYLSSHPSGVAELSAHIGRISMWIDEDYEPSSDVEREIQWLISAMGERGLATHSALRSLIARSGWMADLNQRLLFAPLPDLHPQLGGLLRALRYSCDVQAFLLSDPDHIGLTLKRIGISEEHAASVETSWSEERGEISWRISDDPLSDAIRSISEWEMEGVSTERIAIITPSPEGIAPRLIDRARERDVSLVIRDRVDALETRVGSALIAAVRSDLSEPTDRASLSRRHGLSRDQLDRLAGSSDQIKTLWVLLSIGRELTESRRRAVGASADERLDEDSERGVIWLDELERQLRSLGSRSVSYHDVDLESFLIQIAPPRQIRGDRGAMVLAPNEASGIALERIVVIGIDSLEAVSSSPFVSERTRALHPEVENADWRPIWSALRSSASDHTRLIRDRGDASSPAHPPAAWLMELSADPPAELEWRPRADALRERTLTRRERWEGRLRRASVNPGELELALSTDRRPYSVTELESYNRCPLGWLVSSALEPRSVDSGRSARGTVAHIALAKAMGEPPAERERVIERVITREGAARGIKASDRRSLIRQSSRVIDRYGGWGWPWFESMSEVEMSGELKIAGSLLELTGRLDRIDFRVDESGAINSLSERERSALGLSTKISEDVFPDELDLGWDEDGAPITPNSADPSTERREARELLIIDYKLGSLPNMASALQAHVYPRLACQAFTDEDSLSIVRAFAYISLRLCRASVLTIASPLFEFDGAESRELTRGWERARDLISEAVDGIESGDWARTGGGCQRWCPHHLISETGGGGI